MKVILDDIDFLWDEKDIELITKLWNRGTGIKDICNTVKRDGDEVFLLLLHLSRNGEIKKRKSYIWGKF